MEPNTNSTATRERIERIAERLSNDYGDPAMSSLVYGTLIEGLTALCEEMEREKWQSIESAPKGETESFLVRLPQNSMADYVILQVSRFQGDLYADHMDGNIDYGDRILGATHWQPLPQPPAT